MKKILLGWMLLLKCCSPSMAQSQEAAQLLLNVEKLTELKKILNNMYEGYTVISNGYNTVRDISRGNFNLHSVFLDALMQVSPVVKKYRRVTDIISYQSQLVKEYKSAFNRFRVSTLFNDQELNHMGGVFANLVEQSLTNLDELLMVITSHQLRMSDQERMAAIDLIAADMGDKLSFLRSYNKAAGILALQRQKEISEVQLSKQLQGMK